MAVLRCCCCAEVRSGSNLFRTTHYTLNAAFLDKRWQLAGRGHILSEWRSQAVDPSEGCRSCSVLRILQMVSLLVGMQVRFLVEALVAARVRA